MWGALQLRAVPVGLLLFAFILLLLIVWQILRRYETMEVEAYSLIRNWTTLVIFS